MNLKTGNTLDYYNDDMSRKAVGKLFENLDELADETEDDSAIVGNYNNVPESKPAPPPEAREPAAVERPHHRIFGGDDYDLSMYRKNRRALSEPESFDEEIEDIIKPKKKRRIDSDLPEPEPFDEEIEDIIKPRKKRRIDPDLSEPEPFDEDMEDIIKPRKKRRMDSDLPEPAVIKRAQPEKPYMPPRRGGVVRHTNPSSAVDYVERVQAQREKEETGRTFTTVRRRGRSLRPYAFVLFFVLMVMMAWLIVRGNSLSKKLKDAETALAELDTVLEENMTLKLDNATYIAQIAELEKQLEEPEPVSSTPPESEAPGSTVPSSSTLSPPTEEIILPTTYVVQSGDVLSKISIKFYHTPNEYRKIMEANGLTSDNIQPGTELVIPK